MSEPIYKPVRVAKGYGYIPAGPGQGFGSESYLGWPGNVFPTESECQRICDMLSTAFSEGQKYRATLMRQAIGFAK
jgi:hypothetical protein